jgi:hypothetical protein
MIAKKGSRFFTFLLHDSCSNGGCGLPFSRAASWEKKGDTEKGPAVRAVAGLRGVDRDNPDMVFALDFGRGLL